MPSPLLAIGDKVDPGLVLILDGHQRRSIQPLGKGLRPYLLLQAVERHPHLVEQFPAAASEEVARLGIAPYDGRHQPVSSIFPFI